MKKVPLHVKIIIAMVLGVFWALISGSLGWNKFTIDWIDPFGIIFINCLKFIAIPLVLFSIVGGVAGLGDIRQLGRIGIKTLCLYLLTTIASVSLGLTLVNLLKPGEKYTPKKGLQKKEEPRQDQGPDAQKATRNDRDRRRRRGLCTCHQCR